MRPHETGDIRGEKTVKDALLLARKVAESQMLGGFVPTSPPN